MINVWINNGSGCIMELTECQYINISTYKPSSDKNIPIELKIPRKGLININSKDKKIFYGVMLIFQINIQRELKKMTKKLLKNLIMMELSFL